VAISSGYAKVVEEAGNTNWRYAKESSEYAWLENDLKQARNNKHITWIILFMYHPLYSFRWSHVQGWQDRITPLVNNTRLMYVWQVIAMFMKDIKQSGIMYLCNHTICMNIKSRQEQFTSPMAHPAAPHKG
jgi:hypothetical protein